jgi:hypothetical protein
MAEILLVNPRRRKRRHMSALQRKYFGNPRRKHHRHHRHHASNPRRRRHHYHRNPLSDIQAKIMPTIKAGAIGAVGGLAVDVIAGYLNPQLNTMLGGAMTGNPALTALSKIVYALGVGWLGAHVLKGQGSALAIGGTTVAIHDFAKVELAAAMPSLPLGYVSYGPVVSGVPANMQATRASTYRPVGRMGKYLSGGPRRGMGVYMSGMGDTNFANGIPTG